MCEGKVLHILRGHTQSVTSLVFARPVLVSGGADHQVRIM